MTTLFAEPKTTCLAPWFGSNRMLGHRVGELLNGCEWVGVPFAGGMAELVHIKARTVNVNDLHSHVINLARVLADAKLAPMVYRRLRRVPFHPESLAVAQADCKSFGNAASIFDENARVRWAAAYFAAAWMPRHGSSGRKDEFNGKVSTRWNAGGGDSAKHYWSAVESIRDWHSILRRMNFTCMDWRPFLAKCKDQSGHGIYCDPPFPGSGDAYQHTFSESDYKELERRLDEFSRTKVVCRFYDVPMIRDLYDESHWTWNLLEGRKQTNEAAPEVLLVNKAVA